MLQDVLDYDQPNDSSRLTNARRLAYFCVFINLFVHSRALRVGTNRRDDINS